MGAKSGCRHINRGRIQTTLRQGKRFIYRKCKDCQKDVPEKTTDQKKQYMSGDVPKDINIRSL